MMHATRNKVTIIEDDAFQQNSGGTVEIRVISNNRHLIQFIFMIDFHFIPPSLQLHDPDAAVADKHHCILSDSFNSARWKAFINFLIFETHAFVSA